MLLLLLALIGFQDLRVYTDWQELQEYLPLPTRLSTRHCEVLAAVEVVTVWFRRICAIIINVYQVSRSCDCDACFARDKINMYEKKVFNQFSA